MWICGVDGGAGRLGNFLKTFAMLGDSRPGIGMYETDVRMFVPRKELQVLLLTLTNASGTRFVLACRLGRVWSCLAVSGRGRGSGWAVWVVGFAAQRPNRPGTAFAQKKKEK